MATKYLFSNNATTTLAQSISATATVINVASGDGSLFPSPGSGEAFPITLVDSATELKNEICYCTARSGDQLTVTRGQENTNAVAWSAGDIAAHYITAGTIESWLQESDLDGYATETWVGDGYVARATGSANYSPITAGVNKSAGTIWLSYADDNGDIQYVFAQPVGDYQAAGDYQPAGDYALQTALASEISRAEAVETALSDDKVNRSGDTMTGALTVSEHFGSDTTGELRWGGVLNSTIAGSTYNNLSLYMCELVQKYAYADLQVNYHDGSGNVARADFLFRTDTGRIQAPAGTMAVLTDIPDYPASLGQTGYQKLPNGWIMQWGLVTFTSQEVTISLPISFPNQFFIVQVTDVGNGGLGYGATPASLSTFIARTTNSDVVDGTFIAIGY